MSVSETVNVKDGKIIGPGTTINALSPHQAPGPYGPYLGPAKVHINGLWLLPVTLKFESLRPLTLNLEVMIHELLDDSLTDPGFDTPLRLTKDPD